MKLLVLILLLSIVITISIKRSSLSVSSPLLRASIKPLSSSTSSTSSISTKKRKSTSSSSSSSPSRTLLIVESPSKASTIKKILGPNYEVQSSLGHIRAITNAPTATCSSNVVYGIDIDNDFTPHYDIIPGKESRVTELCSSINEYSSILLASDNDREGESIAWHLASVLSLDTNDCNRITFNEITKKALLEAVSNPRTINMDLVQSQEARAIIDRILGFELTALLVKHTGTRNVSAGRVMSVAAKLILSKEKEIDSFLSTQYFAVSGIFNGNTNANYNVRFQSKDDVMRLLNDLNSNTNSYVITTTDKTVLEKKPLIPFVLSSALKEICRRFSVSSEKALMCLQNLYEKGYISYHRTDSPYLSAEFRDEVKSFIASSYGDGYHHDRVYESKSKTSQEAHEGIRPTDVTMISISSANNTALDSKVYDIIWKRSVASQMTNALYDVHTVHISPTSRTKKEYFVHKKTTIKFDGYTKVYDLQDSKEDKDDNDNDNDNDDDDDNDNDNNDNDFNTGSAIDITKLNIGDKVTSTVVNCTEKARKPPSRYNEGSLIKKMEEIGVGRPSTYVTVIKKLFTREYITRETVKGAPKNLDVLTLKDGSITESTMKKVVGGEKNVLVPSHSANITTLFLENNFKDLLNYEYTAGLENVLDQIAASKVDKSTFLNKFYSEFQPKVTQVRQHFPQSRSRRLGDDSNGRPVFVFATVLFGPTISIGNKGDVDVAYYSNKDLFSLDKVDTITFDEAMEIVNKIKNITPPKINFPYQCNGTTYNLVIKPPQGDSTTHYFEFDKRLISVLPSIDINNITNDDITSCIEAKRHLYDFDEFKVFEGRSKKSPYIRAPGAANGKYPFIFISIDTEQYDISKLTKEDCLEIIMKSPKRFYIPFVSSSTTEATKTASSTKKTTSRIKKADTTTTAAPKKATTTTAAPKKATTTAPKKAATATAPKKAATATTAAPKKRKTTKNSEILVTDE